VRRTYGGTEEKGIEAAAAEAARRDEGGGADGEPLPEVRRSEDAAPGVPDVRHVRGASRSSRSKRSRGVLVRIALDAMGTDRHPAVEVEGAVQALRELPGDLELLLVGDRARIEAELARHEYPARPGAVSCMRRTVIEPGEPAVTAVRRKPDSSIVVGLKLQKEGEADAFVSAGSTGAVMAASVFLCVPLPGVDRPAVGTILPTTVQPCLLIDAGANVDCKPQHLLQFARLGSIYVEDVWQRPNPRVGLLNIGEEPEKGDELTVEAHACWRRRPELHRQHRGARRHPRHVRRAGGGRLRGQRAAEVLRVGHGLHHGC
jgi:hypothetical protein